MIIEEGHPIHSLRAQLLVDKPDLILEFSKYIHLGNGKTRSREIFHITASELTEQWLLENLLLLDDEQELAFHSRVEYNSNVCHIPMVDFVNTTSDLEVNALLKPINDMLSKDIWLCHSGQSLHGYYFELVDNEFWLNYLANLLLCNQSENGGKDIVDQRWIAHSLEHRYSALRWSHNTNRYHSMPSSYGIRVISGRHDFNAS